MAQLKLENLKLYELEEEYDYDDMLYAIDSILDESSEHYITPMSAFSFYAGFVDTDIEHMKGFKVRDIEDIKTFLQKWNPDDIRYGFYNKGRSFILQLVDHDITITYKITKSRARKGSYYEL